MERFICLLSGQLPNAGRRVFLRDEIKLGIGEIQGASFLNIQEWREKALAALSPAKRRRFVDYGVFAEF
ncbi:hypothetical protein [Sinorhizobium meliloti]|uniref:hypothetical protein n=1 Tax=Rhizobium meliloti TaxID=382 RepID=UPI00238047C8|nr:hypothetical protein [Sinorhizobium meliloti]MDE3804765.1 hypothetical protein [Sinorhizobium meliloti]